MRTNISISENLEAIGSVLAEFLATNEVIYLKTKPEIIDFRKDFDGELVLMGAKESVSLFIPNGVFTSFVGMLTAGLFNTKKIILSWDIKRLFSYFYFRLTRSHHININCRVIDLKYGEAFLGVNDKAPETFKEAQRRALFIKDETCRRMHETIHVPLATRVLPKIETAGIRDVVDRKIRHSAYQIEGQVNGRLLCSKEFDGGISVHNMGSEEKQRFRPNQDHTFVVLDYKSHEVCVLQWLSKDERLARIISSGRDIYTTIYSLLYGQKCTDDKRQFIKDAFLPIVYGQQADSLATRLKVSQEEASTLIKKINTYFGTAMGWVQEYQDRVKEFPVVADHFGRTRHFGDKAWSVRNAIVQGPAAAVCLEKLISLYDRLSSHCEIVASIHDAYVLDVRQNELYDIVFYAIEVLQGPSTLAPGLPLRVDVKVGNDLDNLSTYTLK